MSLLTLAILVANAFAAITLLRFGQREERVIVLATIAYVCLPPLVAQFHFQTFRYGIFGVEIVWMIALFWGAMRLERWWPLMAAAAQVVTCLSHILTLFLFEMYLWSAVTLRLGLWFVVSLILLMGSWEAWAHWAVTFKGEVRGKRMEFRDRFRLRKTLVR